MIAPDTMSVLEGETFSFDCHSGLPCFTDCCRDLNLVLTPYDLLRLKKHLGLPSMDLLDRFTSIKPGGHNGYPAVLLKMDEDEGRTCPFVTPRGCRVYEDRPGACRIYPIGRASSRVNGQKGAKEFYFVVKESHCQGFRQPRPWTIGLWTEDQGLQPYTLFNDAWMDIITHRGSLGPETDIPRKLQMFFMASYNLDQFRRFVFRSTFLKRFVIPEERVRKMETEDQELLKLAFQWLKMVLFGEEFIPIRPE
jgi:uncharacterized protein